MKAGDVLRLRQELGLTQSEFGALLGVSITTVWRWENEWNGIHPAYERLLVQLAADRLPQPA